MGKKKKEKKTKGSRYCPKSPQHTHQPHLCKCGTELTRITYQDELRGRKLRWRCPKCGIL